ncbi:MAG: RnfABCDGE type electron transport complex subunit D [Chitinivibrionales bacterium]|nr:RnfABCDGE type electron transport complex subunit D [Chitinivibrionales bacterium]MBD3396227.1 RnfABCDGE type electron transport complex subunit D [Chitinivibrionales bacterium]
MKKPVFLKQKNMLRVLYALVPAGIASIYFFGWRVAVVLVVSAAACFATEWFMADRRGGKVSYACFVTAALYGLSLPPATPFWVVAVGGIVAILFAKEAFGGFGKNVFNPAIVGRAFVYVCFPLELTARFVPAFTGGAGGFVRWSYGSLASAPAYLARAGLTLADGITAATPMWARRDFGFETGLMKLLVGNISGVFEYEGTRRALAAGAAGEVCAVAILLGAIYLIVTKTAQWRLMIATLAGAAAFSLVFHHVLGIHAVQPLAFTLLSGGLMYAAVFMVTDPVSAPKKPLSQWIYGALIGMLVPFFRYKAIFAGGVGFAILLGNMMAPSLDFWLKRIQTSPKKAASS